MGVSAHSWNYKIGDLSLRYPYALASSSCMPPTPKRQSPGVVGGEGARTKQGRVRGCTPRPLRREWGAATETLGDQPKTCERQSGGR